MLYFFGTLFNKGIAFITIPVFSRILPIADYGVVTTYNAWVAIVTMILSLALYMSIRTAFIDYKDKVENYLSVIVTFTVIYGSSISFVIILAIQFMSININNTLIICCLVQSLCIGIIEELSMFLMMKYRYVLRTIFMIVPNFISTVVSIILIRYILENKFYLGRIVANTITYFLFAIAAISIVYCTSKELFNTQYIKHGLRISLPLVFHGIALTILAQSDRTMITYIRNSEQTAIYGLIYNFGMVATVITTALDGVWIPWFTQRMNESKYSDINNISNKYVKLITLAMVCVLMIAPEMLHILATEQYWGGVIIIPPIVLSNYMNFLYTFYVNVEHYYKKTAIIATNTVVAAFLNIILNLFFIKEWGYVGAAYSTLICYFLLFIIHSIYSKRLNKTLFPMSGFFPCLFILLLSIIVFYFMNNSISVRCISTVIVCGVLGITERINIYNYLRNKRNI